MFTVYITGPRTQVSITVPRLETAYYILSHLCTAGRKVRAWDHKAKRFV